MNKLVTLYLISLSIVLLFSSGQSSSWGSAHCAEMVHLAAFPTHHAICWTLSGRVAGSTVSAGACSHHLSIGLPCPSQLHHTGFLLLCLA